MSSHHRCIAYWFVACSLLMPQVASAQSATAEKPKPAEAKPAPPVDLGALFCMRWPNATHCARLKHQPLHFCVLPVALIT